VRSRARRRGLSRGRLGEASRYASLPSRRLPSTGRAHGYRSGDDSPLDTPGRTATRKRPDCADRPTSGIDAQWCLANRAHATALFPPTGYSFPRLGAGCDRVAIRDASAEVSVLYEITVPGLRGSSRVQRSPPQPSGAFSLAWSSVPDAQIRDPPIAYVGDDELTLGSRRSASPSPSIASSASSTSPSPRDEIPIGKAHHRPTARARRRSERPRAAVSSQVSPYGDGGRWRQRRADTCCARASFWGVGGAADPPIVLVLYTDTIRQTPLKWPPRNPAPVLTGGKDGSSQGVPILTVAKG